MTSSLLIEPATAATAAPKRRRKVSSLSCDDCYFQLLELCALGLGEPCATFRESGPNGPLPPRQPMLMSWRTDGD